MRDDGPGEPDSGHPDPGAEGTAGTGGAAADEGGGPGEGDPIADLRAVPSLCRRPPRAPRPAPTTVASNSRPCEAPVPPAGHAAARGGGRWPAVARRTRREPARHGAVEGARPRLPARPHQGPATGEVRRPRRHGPAGQRCGGPSRREPHRHLGDLAAPRRRHPAQGTGRRPGRPGGTARQTRRPARADRSGPAVRPRRTAGDVGAGEAELAASPTPCTCGSSAASSRSSPISTPWLDRVKECARGRVRRSRAIWRRPIWWNRAGGTRSAWVSVAAVIGELLTGRPGIPPARTSTTCPTPCCTVPPRTPGTRTGTTCSTGWPVAASTPPMCGPGARSRRPRRPPRNRSGTPIAPSTTPPSWCRRSSTPARRARRGSVPRRTPAGWRSGSRPGSPRRTGARSTGSGGRRAGPTPRSGHWPVSRRSSCAASAPLPGRRHRRGRPGGTGRAHDTATLSAVLDSGVSRRCAADLRPARRRGRLPGPARSGREGEPGAGDDPPGDRAHRQDSGTRACRGDRPPAGGGRAAPRPDWSRLVRPGHRAARGDPAPPRRRRLPRGVPGAALACPPRRGHPALVGAAHDSAAGALGREGSGPPDATAAGLLAAALAFDRQIVVFRRGVRRARRIDTGRRIGTVLQQGRGARAPGSRAPRQTGRAHASGGASLGLAHRRLLSLRWLWLVAFTLGLLDVIGSRLRLGPLHPATGQRLRRSRAVPLGPARGRRRGPVASGGITPGTSHPATSNPAASHRGKSPASNDDPLWRSRDQLWDEARTGAPGNTPT